MYVTSRKSVIGNAKEPPSGYRQQNHRNVRKTAEKLFVLREKPFLTKILATRVTDLWFAY